MGLRSLDGTEQHDLRTILCQAEGLDVAKKERAQPLAANGFVNDDVLDDRKWLRAEHDVRAQRNQTRTLYLAVKITDKQRGVRIS